MKFSTIILSLAASLGFANAASAVDCTQFAGSWTGTCTRVNITPATQVVNPTVSFTPGCTEMTVTGMPLILNAIPLDVDMELFTQSSTTSNPSIYSRLENTTSVNEDNVDEQYLYVATSSALTRLFISTQSRLRTIGKSVTTVKKRNNGQLRFHTRIKNQSWTNGNDSGDLVAEQTCDLDPV